MSKYDVWARIADTERRGNRMAGWWEVRWQCYAARFKTKAEAMVFAKKQGTDNVRQLPRVQVG